MQRARARNGIICAVAAYLLVLQGLTGAFACALSAGAAGELAAHILCAPDRATEAAGVTEYGGDPARTADGCACSVCCLGTWRDAATLPTAGGTVIAAPVRIAERFSFPVSNDLPVPAGNGPVSGARAPPRSSI